MRNPDSNANGHEFELCFRSLRAPGCAYAFPCDAVGRVDMDTLSERQRDRYLYARAVIGREFSPPRKQRNSVR